MSKILIVNPYFFPGYKSGGPQQTVRNICDVFGKTNDIYLVTQNHDYGDVEKYNLPNNKWIQCYGIKVMYVDTNDYGQCLFKELYKEFDTIYACGLFCKSTIDFIRLHNNTKKRLFVAPMGVFSKNALAIRSGKKHVFLRLFSLLGYFNKIIWSFTSEEERKEAIIAIGEKNIKEFIIAEDLPRFVDFKQQREKIRSKEDKLNIIFLSRIVPKKNLLYAIRILNGIHEGEIKFDIYGIIEDKEYWEQCENELKALPENIEWHYCGLIRPDESISIFERHDVFLFPTQGENFGHVIYESLSAGCLPIISETTPWKDLFEKHCGSVVMLDDVSGFRNSIQMYQDMTNEEIMQMKINAIEYAEQKYNRSIKESGYKKVFCEYGCR